MIRETLERIAPFVAALAAVSVFAALCVAGLRGVAMQAAMYAIGGFALAFFLAMACDRRIHRVLTSAAGDWEKMRAQNQDAKEAQSTTTLLLTIVLFAELWLSFFVLGVTAATTIVAMAGFAITVSLSTCEYVRWAERAGK